MRLLSRRIEAVAFDLGETLIYFEGVPLNWQPLYREALAAVAVGCGVEADEGSVAAAEAALARHNGRLNPRTVEVTTAQVFTDVLTALGASCDHIDAAAEAFFEVFVMKRACYTDSAATLDALRARDLRLGLLTDVPYGMPRAVARRLVGDLEPYFDTWLTSVEAGYCKPDPRGLLLLADRLGVAPSAMAYIGNEPKDVAAAKAAGMIAVLVDRIGALPALGADVRVRDLYSLLPLFSSDARRL